jgi:subtilase family serine protease
VVLVPGVSDPGVVSADVNEASLDVEWSGAVAKNATIIFVNGGSNGVYNNALPYAIDQNLAPVISLSYGNCEANWSSSSLQQFSVLAQQANTQGITILAASGDSGPADCDYSNSTTVVLTSATHGYAVDFPASLPYVTAMGGTEFNEGAETYWLPAPGTTDVSPSALSYIPEMVWNDTSTTNGLRAGGGGVSMVFAKPSWQVGITPNDGFRDVPDLSLNASPYHDAYLVCVQGSCANGYRLPANDPSYPNGLTVAGGTSAGAPTTAGIVALINQQMNTPKGQGNINPILYSLTTTSPAAFHDIITGNNLVPCTAGSTDCPPGGQIGYTATIGYDLASGLGSYNAFNLVTAPDVWNLPPPTLTSPANGATDEPVSPQFTWTAVAGNAGYRIMIATSSASLPTNPAASACSACTVVGATIANQNSYTPPSALAAGTTYYWEVQALGAPGSGQNALWSAVSSFTTVTPDFSLSASPSTLTISPGSSEPSTLTVTRINNFSGTPTFTCSVPSTLVGVTCTVGSMGGNNTATVTITASTSATSYPMLPRNPPLGGWWAAGVAMLCALLIARARLRRVSVPAVVWHMRHLALGVVIVILLFSFLNCGGGSSGGGGGNTPLPPAESGTVTITGTSGTTTRTATISVSVS